MRNPGFNKERQLSKQLHYDSVPILISSISLRSRGCGQVDLACFKPFENSIDIYEVKTDVERGVSFNQMSRLKRSQEWMNCIFEPEVRLRVI